ncbi:hypothetical protein DFH08DRAFT_827846 [Mycena albidolilacea]|uniref:Uncharacterized protein n=1 Tax=Mycena albidolilacea TaxID=1033008 RepID=A0AAD6YXF3_9AGAR|nr:hypothetical protein DFH08DRAFT_827846 [Mycena albidolilacea]
MALRRLEAPDISLPHTKVGIARHRSAEIITADSVTTPRLSVTHGGAARQAAPRKGLSACRQQSPVGLSTSELCSSKLEVADGIDFAAKDRHSAGVNQWGPENAKCARINVGSSTQDLGQEVHRAAVVHNGQQPECKWQDDGAQRWATTAGSDVERQQYMPTGADVEGCRRSALRGAADLVLVKRRVACETVHQIGRTRGKVRNLRTKVRTVSGECGTLTQKSCSWAERPPPLNPKHRIAGIKILSTMISFSQWSSVNKLNPSRKFARYTQVSQLHLLLSNALPGICPAIYQLSILMRSCKKRATCGVWKNKETSYADAKHGFWDKLRGSFKSVFSKVPWCPRLYEPLKCEAGIMFNPYVQARSPCSKFYNAAAGKVNIQAQASEAQPQPHSIESVHAYLEDASDTIRDLALCRAIGGYNFGAAYKMYVTVRLIPQIMSALKGVWLKTGVPTKPWAAAQSPSGLVLTFNQLLSYCKASSSGTFANRLSRVAWPNGLRRLAEFEIAVAGGRGVACGVAWLVLGYTRHSHYLLPIVLPFLHGRVHIVAINPAADVDGVGRC